MTPTRRKPRMLLRTTFTAFTVLSIACWLLTIKYSLVVKIDHCLLMSIHFGAFSATTVFGDENGNSRGDDGTFQLTGSWVPVLFVQEWTIEESWPKWVDRSKSMPAIERPWHMPGGFSFGLLPAVIILVSGNAFWYCRDWRKRPRPGCCPNCGYDLRGSVDGRCSECGTIAEPMRQ